MRPIAYLRVSTDEQGESGLGLEAQLDACAAWAAREQAPGPVLPFTDSGISGAAPIDQRPGLIAALAELRPGDALVVAKRDRLGRDPIVVAMIESVVTRKKCRVVSAAGEGTGGDSPSDVLMRRMVDAFAEYERLVIRSRTRAALDAKRRRGERTGTIPYGTRLLADGKSLAPDDAERVVIGLMATLRTEGVSDRRIAARLTEAGVRTKKGAAKWSPSAVRSILGRENSRV